MPTVEELLEQVQELKEAPGKAPVGTAVGQKSKKTDKTVLDSALRSAQQHIERLKELAS